MNNSKEAVLFSKWSLFNFAKVKYMAIRNVRIEDVPKLLKIYAPYVEKQQSHSSSKFQLQRTSKTESRESHRSIHT